MIGSGLYALFGKATKRIRKDNWGAKIHVDKNGKSTTNPIDFQDTAVQPAIDELNAALNDLAPIDLAETAQLNYSGLGFGMQIKTATGKGIAVTGTGGSSTFNAINGVTGTARLIDDTDKSGISVIPDPTDSCLQNIWLKMQTLVMRNGFVINRTKPITHNPIRVGTINLRDFCDCASAGIAPCETCCPIPCIGCPAGEKLPRVIYATFTDVTNCDCAIGTVLKFVYSDSDSAADGFARWNRDTTHSICTTSLASCVDRISCGAGGTDGLVYNGTCTGFVTFSGTCEPLNMVGTGSLASASDCCGTSGTGSMTITLTE